MQDDAAIFEVQHIHKTSKRVLMSLEVIRTFGTIRLIEAMYDENLTDISKIQIESLLLKGLKFDYTYLAFNHQLCAF